MAGETVTLTVDALRELLKKQESACFWVNLPYTSDHNYRRVIRIREQYRTNDDVTLEVAYEEDGYETKRTFITVSEIFTLAQHVRDIVFGLAKDRVSPDLVHAILRELHDHDHSASHITKPELLAQLHELL